MNEVRVLRTALLEKLERNRSGHRDVFEKAQVKYREQVIEELDQMLSDAKLGRKIKRYVLLPEPEDHTNDYDRVIAMLKMSVEDEIKLSELDFGRYVLDHWEWEAHFASNTRSYLSK